MPTSVRSALSRRVASVVDRAVSTAVRRELQAAGLTGAERAGVRSHARELNQPAKLAELNREAAAVWDEHEDEEYRRDQSHWRGVGRWSDEQWQLIGDETWRRVARLYQAAGRAFPEQTPPVVLEWGPGGGANLYRFADHAKVIYGVDIAAKNLAETARVLAEKGHQEFRPVHLEGEPASVRDQITDPIDLFLSTSVFQHFPSQEYGVEVLRVMRSLMVPGSMAYVQIRFDNGNPQFVPKDPSSYRTNHITATSYDLSAFWDILIEVGFSPLMVTNINSKANYAGFHFTVPSSDRT